MRAVLITGAAGRIGSWIAPRLRDRYRLRLMVQSPAQATDALRACGEVVAADLSDLPAMKRACAGIDTVVHLAAAVSPQSTWAELLPANIVGAYHCFAAAIAARCRRVVFASSIHAVSASPADRQVRPDDPVDPGTLYGATKCFGEALARYCATQEGLSAIVLRLGACVDLPTEPPSEPPAGLDALLSYADLRRLIERCIDVEDVRFALLHALSGQPVRRLDTAAASDVLGWLPEDDPARGVPAFARLGHSDRDAALNVVPGGLRSGMRDDLR